MGTFLISRCMMSNNIGRRRTGNYFLRVMALVREIQEEQDYFLNYAVVRLAARLEDLGLLLQNPHQAGHAGMLDAEVLDHVSHG